MAARSIMRGMLSRLRWVLPFFTLPAFTGLLVYGAFRSTVLPFFPEMIHKEPDQVVLHFLREIGIGQTADAREALTPALRHLDPGFLGLRLDEDYGAPVFITAKTLLRTPDYAIIASDTCTERGCRYIITWTLHRQQDRWIIINYSDLRSLLPDLR